MAKNEVCLNCRRKFDEKEQGEETCWCSLDCKAKFHEKYYGGATCGSMKRRVKNLEEEP